MEAGGSSPGQGKCNSWHHSGKIRSQKLLGKSTCSSRGRKRDGHQTAWEQGAWWWCVNMASIGAGPGTREASTGQAGPAPGRAQLGGVLALCAAMCLVMWGCVIFGNKKESTAGGGLLRLPCKCGLSIREGPSMCDLASACAERGAQQQPRTVVLRQGDTEKSPEAARPSWRTFMRELAVGVPGHEAGEEDAAVSIGANPTLPLRSSWPESARASCCSCPDTARASCS